MMGCKRGAASADRGFALVMVLWATALLSVIGAAFAFGVRSHTELAIGHVDRAHAAALADAGFAWAVSAVMQPTSPTSEEKIAIDGTPYEVVLPSGRVRIAIVSEAGKVNLNSAPEELLLGLANALVTTREEDEGWAERLLDWRDEDSRPRSRGAEDVDYSGAGRPYGAADRPFESLGELSQVLGLSAGLLAELLPHVTLYSRGGKIDPAAASKTVLLAVPGLSSEQVEGYLAARREGQQQAAAQYLTTAGPRYLVREGASRRSATVSIHASATTLGGAVASRYAVVRVQPSSYEVLVWQTAVPPLPEPPAEEALPMAEI